MNVNVEGTNLQMKEVISPSEDPTLFIFTYNNLDLDTALNKCALDSFRFNIKSSPQVIYSDSEGKDYASKGFYRGPGGSEIFLIKKYPGEGSKTYQLHLKEPWGRFRQLKRIRNLLALNKEEFYLQYTLKPFYSQIEPMANNLDERESYGCYVINREIYEADMLKVIGTEHNINSNPKKILCVKEFDNYQYSLEGCTFFELTSEIEIIYTIDLSKGEDEIIFSPGFP